MYPATPLRAGTGGRCRGVISYHTAIDSHLLGPRGLELPLSSMTPWGCVQSLAEASLHFSRKDLCGQLASLLPTLTPLYLFPVCSLLSPWLDPNPASAMPPPYTLGPPTSQSRWFTHYLFRIEAPTPGSQPLSLVLPGAPGSAVGRFHTTVPLAWPHLSTTASWNVTWGSIQSPAIQCANGELFDNRKALSTHNKQKLIPNQTHNRFKVLLLVLARASMQS